MTFIMCCIWMGTWKIWIETSGPSEAFIPSNWKGKCTIKKSDKSKKTSNDCIGDGTTTKGFIWHNNVVHENNYICKVFFSFQSN